MSKQKAITKQVATVYDIHKQLVQIAADEIALLPEHLKDLTAAERVRFVLAVLPYTAPHVEKVSTNYADWGNSSGGGGWDF